MTDYEWYKSHGICTECRHEKALPGKALCAKCAKRNKIYYDQRYQDMKAGGICVTCGKEPVWREGSIRCRECMDKIKDAKRALYDRRVAEGICIRCGKTEAEPNGKMCASCSAKEKAYLKKYRERKKQEAKQCS